MNALGNTIYAKGSSHQSYDGNYVNKYMSDIRYDCKNDFPPSHDGLHVSEDVYWKKYYLDYYYRYEWNNGVLEEKMSDSQSSRMIRWVQALFEEYFRVHSNAEYLVSDIGFRLDLTDEICIRKPDMSIIHESNPVSIELEDSTFEGTYDICIEFLSDSTTEVKERDTIQKKREYRKAGVKEYFIFDRTGKETAFYRLDKNGYYRRIKPTKDGVIKSKVLPGFQFREKDLYEQPSLIKMSKDKIYKSFVRVDLQEAEARIEKESKKAEKERLRADKEAEKAERERLKAEKESKKAKKERLKAEKEAKNAKNERLRAEKAEEELRKLKEELKKTHK